MATVNNDIVKSEILIQAQRLFQQFGLKKTTMDEIAVACGKAKSTLYHYFESKEQVFDAVVHMELINLRQRVRNKVEEQKKMHDKIRTYFIELNKGIEKEVTLSRIIKMDFSSKRIAQKYYLTVMKFEKTYLTRIMEDSYDSDEYKNVCRQDISGIAELLLVAFFSTVAYSMAKESLFDKEKLQQTIDLIVFMLFY